MDYTIVETRREPQSDGSVIVFEDHLFDGVLPGPEYHDVPKQIWPDPAPPTATQVALAALRTRAADIQADPAAMPADQVAKFAADAFTLIDTFLAAGLPVPSTANEPVIDPAPAG